MFEPYLPFVPFNNLSTSAEATLKYFYDECYKDWVEMGLKMGAKSHNEPGRAVA